MVKNEKLSRKGKIFSCGKCGENGHNQRACTGPRNKQTTGKWKKDGRSEGVPDMEASEVNAGIKSASSFSSNTGWKYPGSCLSKGDKYRKRWKSTNGLMVFMY